MDLKDKNEKLQYSIDRFDNYYEAINSKGNLYLTINTFILGGMIAGYFTLDSMFNFGIGLLLLFVSALAANLASVLFTLFAIKPYLNDKKENPDGSVIFFADVADYHSNHFDNIWRQMDDQKWHDDLKTQARLLSFGLKRKFTRLTYATWFIAAQIVAVIIFGINLLKY